MINATLIKCNLKTGAVKLISRDLLHCQLGDHQTCSRVNRRFLSTAAPVYHSCLVTRDLTIYKVKEMKVEFILSTRKSQLPARAAKLKTRSTGKMIFTWKFVQRATRSLRASKSWLIRRVASTDSIGAMVRRPPRRPLPNKLMAIKH